MEISYTCSIRDATLQRMRIVDTWMPAIYFTDRDGDRDGG